MTEYVTTSVLNYQTRIVAPAGTPLPVFITQWNAMRGDVQKALNVVADTANEAQDTAEEAAAVRTYTVGASSVSGHRVLMTVDSNATVQHANPALLGNSARVVGIATGAALSGAVVDAQWLGVLSDNSFSFDLSKRIFCGADGMLVQTPPTSGFSRCVGQPITPTSMRVEIDPPIFLVA